MPRWNNSAYETTEVIIRRPGTKAKRKRMKFLAKRVLKALKLGMPEKSWEALVYADFKRQGYTLEKIRSLASGKLSMTPGGSKSYAQRGLDIWERRGLT